VAPKFNMISHPNEWKRQIRSKSQATDPTSTQMKQLEFWQQFKEYANNKYQDLRINRKPSANHWFDLPIARADCHVSLTCLLSRSQVGCEIYIPDSKELFVAFSEHRDEITKNLGSNIKLDWLELPTKKASRIKATHDFDLANSETWDQAFEWLAVTYNSFKREFGSRCKQ